MGRKECRKERKVTVNRGQEHAYLGMTIRYEPDRSMTVDMIDYVDDMIEKCSVKLHGRMQSTLHLLRHHSKQFDDSTCFAFVSKQAMVIQQRHLKP